jgi:hypothetical protein
MMRDPGDHDAAIPVIMMSEIPIQERPRPHRRHRGVHPGAQRSPEAFRLDEVSGGHPGKGGAL